MLSTRIQRSTWRNSKRKRPVRNRFGDRERPTKKPTGLMACGLSSCTGFGLLASVAAAFFGDAVGTALLAVAVGAAFLAVAAGIGAATPIGTATIRTTGAPGRIRTAIRGAGTLPSTGSAAWRAIGRWNSSRIAHR